MLNQSLLLSNSEATTDALQVLNRNRRTIAIDCFTDYAVGDVPQLPLDRTMLLTRQPFERAPLVTAFTLPFRFSLETSALTEASATNLLDCPAGERLSRRSKSDAVDAAINSEHVSAGSVWDLLFSDEVQIPHTPSTAERH